MNQTDHRWEIIGRDAGQAAELAARTGISEITAQLLINRKIKTPDEAKSFLAPNLNDLHDPWLLPDAKKAAERIHQAVENGERIVVYGDYDVDGITATALLLKCLRLIDANHTYYLPDRIEEGYGMNPEAIQKIIDEGAGLIISVDCGIASVEEVRLARDAGVDVIITDHHEASPQSAELLDVAHSVVTTRLEGCEYPFKELAGVGIAFKLAWAIGKNMAGGKQCGEDFRKFLIDAVALAALGTIADVVPLVGENRILAAFGLRGLGEGDSVGLRELRRYAGIEGKTLTAFDVAFKLGPRMNAAGRLGTAREAVELLITDSKEAAGDIADFLDAENTFRQKIQEKIVEDARSRAMEGPPPQEAGALVLAAEEWHPGVVGVVAAKLVDAFNVPAVVLSIDGDEAHGSARSVEGFDLFAALETPDVSRHLTAWGGHAMAAGMRLPVKNLDAFRESLCRIASEQLPADRGAPPIKIDAEVPLNSLTRNFMRELARLEPFGEGNRSPTLATRRLEVVGRVRRMGAKGDHLSFFVRDGDVSLRAVAFRMGDLADEISAARGVSLAYFPEPETYRGTGEVELKVKDIIIEPARKKLEVF